jgi:hypothetical protein
LLHISPTTVIEELKKSRLLQSVNEAKLAELEPTPTIVKLCQWEDTTAELDEMWSFVGANNNNVGYGTALITRVAKCWHMS